ncbi:hypothetical protein SU32_06935 [Ahrensia marina]|uniref:Uncharacterized protein n=1 Tax=Ahrensia marina TaxID=1514904 RepID=A0A0M9GNF4_9HYPH|nr:hypothetical protein SU32_06935 [Ahrensia marina]
MFSVSDIKDLSDLNSLYIEALLAFFKSYMTKRKKQLPLTDKSSKKIKIGGIHTDAPAIV